MKRAKEQFKRTPECISQSQCTTAEPLEVEISIPLVLESVLVEKKILPVFGNDAPEWARRARQCAAAGFLPRIRKTKGSEAYNVGFECGQNEACWKLLLPDTDHDFLQRKVKAMKLPTKLAAEFLHGYALGEKLSAEVAKREKEMFERTKCFLEIAKCWREIVAKRFVEPADLHEWLTRDRGLLASHNDSKAEVRKICSLIGFSQRKKAEKPPKEK